MNPQPSFHSSKSGEAKRSHFISISCNSYFYSLRSEAQELFINKRLAPYSHSEGLKQTENRIQSLLSPKLNSKQVSL